MNTLELYSTELWAKCSLLHREIKNIVSDNRGFDDTILKRDLMECSFFLRENLVEACSDIRVRVVFLKQALSFTKSLEKALTMTNAKFYITKETFYYLMGMTNDIKAIIHTMIIKESV